MKKIFFILVLLFGFAATNVQAGFLQDVGDTISEGIEGRTEGPVPSGEFDLPAAANFGAEIGENESLRQFILRVVNFSLSFLGLIAVAFVIFAGFLYVTAGGEEAQHEKAKKIVLYASMGIIVILASFAIVNTLIKNVPTGSDDRLTQQREALCGNAILDSDVGETCDWSVLVPPATSNPDCPDKCLYEDGSEFDPGDSGELAGVVISIATTTEGEVKNYGEGFLVPLTADATSVGVTLTAEITGLTNALWIFGDGIREEVVPLPPGGQYSTNHNYSEGLYEIAFVGQTEEGTIIGGSTNLIVGGLDVKFEASKIDPVVNEPVTLDASASRVAVGTIVGYDWACVDTTPPTTGMCFAGTATASGKQVTAQFTEQGNYEVTLTLSTSIGTTTTATQIFSVKGDQPTAIFAFQVSEDPLTPGLYSFDATGSKDISGGTSGLTYEWDWEYDGTTFTPDEGAVRAIVTHTFETTGDKTVALRVTQNYQGAEKLSEIFSLLVSGIKTLGVNFEAPRSPLTVGQEFTFRGVSPDAETFAWTFDPTENVNLIDPPALPEVRASFGASGVYRATLTVTKTLSAAETNAIEKPVYVREEGSPVAVPIVTIAGTSPFESPVTVRRNRTQAIAFASGSFDEAGRKNGEAGYSATETWSVDGSIVTPEQIPSTLSQVRTYRIQLRVSRPGNTNVSDTADFSVIVENVAPEVTDLTSEWNEQTGQITVTATATDSDGSIEDYRFEILENGRVVDAQAGLAENSATFSMFPGTHDFYFRVTVTDSDGAQVQFTTNVPLHVENPETNRPPEILGSVSASPSTSPFVGQEVTFSAQIQDLDKDELSYTWNFGDGGQPTQGTIPLAPNTIATLSVPHTFLQVGQFPVTLIITDSESSDTTAPLNMHVVHTQPPLITAPLSETHEGHTYTFRVTARDPEGQPLLFTWFKDQEAGVPAETGEWVQDLAAGQHTISVQISDGDNDPITSGPLNIIVPE